jgi:uncharacterized membrane protein
MKWRSREPSRLEGFSDAVFGFALTLLVVSLEAPRTFDELTVVVRGFLPFAVTFALVAWIWYEHYAFFRLFDPDDRITIVLNFVLLFVVLFYVYPLKFLFSLVIGMILGERGFAGAYSREGQGTWLMIIYGVGFIVVWTVMALMYLNVLRRRAAMQLSRVEVFDARAGAVYHVATAAVGVLSVAIVLIGGDRAAAWSGISYALLGPVHGVLGAAIGSRRASVSASADEDAATPVEERHA